MGEISEKVAAEYLQRLSGLTVIYTGVFLDDRARRTLRSWWEREVGPVHSKEFMHHMTLAFRPDPASIYDLPLGKEVQLEVVGFAEDDKGQAVAVQTSSVRSKNKVPHITVATDGSTKPYYSNQLLDSSLQSVRGPTIKGRVGYFDGSSVQYDLP